MGARNELKTLAKENAEFVAKHLVMAAMLVDDDPEQAHLHAVSASRRGGRIAMVRETLAITAYRKGDYALALRELRTYRRISGRDDQIALMVDSERGLGRPDRALELGRSVDVNKLDVAQQVQLAIVMSGARLDQGQNELALAELEIPQLDRKRAYSWSPALFTAYATVLEELGRDLEAKDWHRAADIAADALEAAEHDEYEALEVISEANPDYDPEIHGDPFEDESDDAGAAVDVADVSAEAEVATVGDADADASEVDNQDTAEVAAEAPAEGALDPDSFDSASIQEQIEAEYQEILAEVEAAVTEPVAGATNSADAAAVVEAEAEEEAEVQAGVAEHSDAEAVEPAPAEAPAAADADEAAAVETDNAKDEGKNSAQNAAPAESEDDAEDDPNQPSLFDF